MDEDVTLRRRTTVPLLLIGIFALALFVRAFFAWDLALRDLLVSGGSDAYYYAWINEYIATTGNHLVRDPMLNFPIGMNNPRPPIYAWSVVLTGMLLGGIQGSLELGIWHSFLFSTALWGALTIFPTYFVGKQILGQRTGLVAAFFLAILPAHIQRTPLSNGDHDALVLFFVVTAFFFFLKALGELNEREWVRNWGRPREIYHGFKGLFLENRRALLFAVMGGTALATVALTWQGWAYGPVVIIAYFLVQMLVHKVQNRDPLGVLVLFAVTLGTALLLAAPYYVATGFVRTWFDVPLSLYAIALGLGFLFTIFHRLPWLLVVGPLLIGFGAGLAITSAISPSFAATLATGFGYFVPDKVFETISEAQPPEFSLVMLSFGMVTSVLAFVGIALMLIEFIRRPRPDYLFLLAWSVAAIYMAIAAVRFLFNASPAFAITSAWVTVLVVERLGLQDVRKAVATTGGSRLGAFRKVIKVRHLVGAFFVAALIMVPNAWSGIDAGVPFEKKRDFDVEVFQAMPEFLRPPGYREGVDLFYFGAFGYSLPLKARYYPQAWAWLRTQDADVFPRASRPAFLSWWDYGFEAIQEGRHPTVADNFQNGFEYAGHFLLSQSENDGIAVLNARLLHGEISRKGAFSPSVQEALEQRDLDPDLVRDVLQRPAAYIPLIRSDPERFGIWDQRLEPRNARVIYLRGVLTESLDLDGQASLYNDLLAATGNSVRYFAVDSRLIPFSGTNTGIFYAPVKLTDHRTIELPDLRSIPRDFYRLIAETDQGNYDLDRVPPTARIQDIRIEYLEPFYNSLLYRIFFGVKGSDIGQPDEGLPGFSGPLRSEDPRHGWMLKHFKLVYRTAYFNPHPPSDVQNHSGDWTALNIIDGLEIQERIDAGEMEGTVDVSPAGFLSQGVVMLKYSAGTPVRGRVTSEEGAPLAGIRVTAVDDFFIPHDFTETDPNGFYEVTAPFGNATLIATTGEIDNRTQVGSEPLGTFPLDLPDTPRSSSDLAQGAIQHDFAVKTATMHGSAFHDLNGNAVRDEGETGVEGLTVEMRNALGDLVASTTTGLDGFYEIRNLLPARYPLRLLRGNETLQDTTVLLPLGSIREKDLDIPVGRLFGSVVDEFGNVAETAVITIEEMATGRRLETTADAAGNYTFVGLIRGNYTITAALGDRGTLTNTVEVGAPGNTTKDLNPRPLATIAGRTLLSFRPSGFVTVNFHSRLSEPTHSVVTDATGRFTTRVPEGTYTLYALHFDEGKPHALLRSLEVVGGESLNLDFNLEAAVRVTGIVIDEAGLPVEAAPVTFERGGAPVTFPSGPNGFFLAYLPPGNYGLWSLYATSQHRSAVTLGGSTELEVALTPAVPTMGKVFYDLNGDSVPDPAEGLEGVRIEAGDAAGGAFAFLTEGDGDFEVPLLNGVLYTLSIEERGFHPVSLGPLTPANLTARGPIELQPMTVAVQGQLNPLDPVALQGTRVAFIPLADGAQAAEVTADAQGRFSGTLLPGLYRVEVDEPLNGEDERLQGATSPALRIPVGRSPGNLIVDVVRRVHVEGVLSVAGNPFNGSLAFSGPEGQSLAVAGSYGGFLRPGNYTLYATTSVGPDRYALLEYVAITAPANLSAPSTNITTLQQASVLTGTVRVNGATLQAGLALAVSRDDGASLGVTTKEGGSYEFVGTAGTYAFSLDWRGIDRLEGSRRFVQYTLGDSVVLTLGEERAHDFTATRTLDNATLSGTVSRDGIPISARLTFEAINETALGTVVEAFGPFSVPLAPGRYNVYAVRDSGQAVSLSQIEVLPAVGGTVAINLEPGYRIRGVASMPDGSEEVATVAFAAAAGHNVTTDPSGLFEVSLPAGTYSVVASVERTERGVSVTYRATESLTLEGDSVLNLPLRRIEVPRVSLLWDTGQRTSVVPGGQVVYTVTVRNTGNVDDRFVFDGSPQDWTFEFAPTSVTLPYGLANERTVQITITAPDDAIVEHEQTFVGATSDSDPSVRGVTVIEIDVFHFRDVALERAQSPPTLSPEALEYPVRVANTGNGKDLFTVLLLNAETLKLQGWTPTLSYTGQISEDRLEDVEVIAEGGATATLRLNATGVVVKDATAFLVAYSQADRDVEATLDIRLEFPSLAIPDDGLLVEGKNIRMTPAEFPIVPYGLLAAFGAIVALLILRRRRRRRRR